MIAAWQAFKREGKVDVRRARKEGCSPLLFSFTRCHAPKFLFPSLSNAYHGGYTIDYPNIIRFLQGSFRRWFFIIRHLSLQLCIFLGAKWETLLSVPGGRPGWRDVGLRSRGSTPYNGLYGEALPERGIFFRLQVYEGVGISLVEVYEMVAKSFISVWKGFTDAFCGWEKVEKTFWFCNLLVFQRQCIFSG